MSFPEIIGFFYIYCWEEDHPRARKELISIVFRVTRLQLSDFSEKVIDTKAAGYNVPSQYASGGIGGAGGSGAAGSNVQMEVDSNASTPA